MAKGGGCEGIWSTAGFKCTEQDTLDFMEKVYSYWNHYSYPALRKYTVWKLYLLKPSQWFKHHSILVQSAETEEHFTIELIISHDGVTPFSRHFDPSTESHSHLETTTLGEIHSSAVDLFHTALHCLKEFGPYHEVTNNCQDYCKVLAKRLGCSAPWTDVQKTAAIAGATAVAGLGLAWLLKSAVDWFSSKEDEDKEKKKDSH